MNRLQFAGRSLQGARHYSNLPSLPNIEEVIAMNTSKSSGTRIAGKERLL